MPYEALLKDPNYKAPNDLWKTNTLGGKVKTAAEQNGWNAKLNLAPICDKFHKTLADYWKWFPPGKRSGQEGASRLLDGNNETHALIEGGMSAREGAHHDSLDS